MPQKLTDSGIGLQEGQRIPIGELLSPKLFSFRRELDEALAGRNHQERSLIYPMPWIVTTPTPLLTAAQINTQVEFDRALRTVAYSPSCRDKRLVFISGLNIDISPQPGAPIPTTKFVPWAAFVRDKKGEQRILEQPELVSMLHQQSLENPDQIDLDSAIREMSDAEMVEVKAANAG